MFHAAFVSRLAVAALVLSIAGPALGGLIGHAGRVVSYDPGTNQFQFGSYDNPETALGVSPTDTGSWGGTTFHVTPLNSPWSPDDIVSVGLGGHLTLELDRYALPQLGTLELGVFAMQMLTPDTANGGTKLFYSSNQAIVEVSTDGQNWISLNGGNLLAFDIPAAAFQDAAGTISADYHKPFTGTLDDLTGFTALDDMLAVYDGSAGGTWLDLSSAGLDQIGFLRFSVPESAAFSFQLEGISLASAAIGAAVPEPASLVLLGLGTLAMLRRRRA